MTASEWQQMFDDEDKQIDMGAMLADLAACEKERDIAKDNAKYILRLKAISDDQSERAAVVLLEARETIAWLMSFESCDCKQHQNARALLARISEVMK